jgi:hypothetical protein
MVFLDAASGNLVLIDVSQAAAARGAVLKPNAGGELRCPQWDRDGGSFVFSESDTADGRIYRVAWTDHEPAAPELLYRARAALCQSCSIRPRAKPVIHIWKP